MELLMGRETFLLNFIYKHVGKTLVFTFGFIIVYQTVSKCKNDESQHKVH